MTNTPNAAPRAFDPIRFGELVQRRGMSLGRPCYYTPVTGSTNSDLMRSLHSTPPNGTLHIADLQTQGRGRYGNRWSSPRAKENLLFSVLLRPKLQLEKVSCFTLAVGLAVRDAVAPHLEHSVGIKWTNDVMAAGRKLAGILVESQLQGNEMSALVVGIGLNVHMTELPDEISTIATSMALLESRCVDREQLLVDILMALERRTEMYEQHGLAAILEDLRRYDAIGGKLVRIGEKTGVARGITDQGALLLDQGNPGGLVELTSGLVQILECNGD